MTRESEVNVVVISLQGMAGEKRGKREKGKGKRENLAQARKEDCRP